MRKITFITAFFFCLFGFAQTSVPQLILADQVWTPAGSPYLIDKNVFIDSGVTVTVQPGVEVIGIGRYIKVDIDGNFQIHGTKDSNVFVRNLEFAYSATSGEFQQAAGHTTEVRHATIIGQGVGRRLFYLSGGIHFGIYNTEVDSAYYTVQYFNNSTGNIGSLTVDSCDFAGIDDISGYILYLSGYNTTCEITNSYFHDARYVYLAGEITLSNNLIENLNSCKIPKNAQTNVLATCNTFSNVGSIDCAFSSNQDTSTNFTFENNSVDSNSQSIFTVSGSLSGGPFPTISVAQNNFLGTGTKAKISGYNPDKTTFDVFDMKNNYWGTTDTTIIANAIIDYNDDVAHFAKIDFSNPLTSKVLPCQSILPCPNPSIAYSQTDNSFVFYDSANTSSYTRVWDFGDGNSDTTSTDSVSYGYSNGGSYTACLYALDNNGVVCDSSCVQVVVPNLFCEASYFVAIDSTNPFNLFIVNTSTGVTHTTTYNWSFGDGTTVNEQTPSHAYSNFGEYNVCLTITDVNGCNSLYCDSLGMDENGNVLKTEGFTIRVLDQTQLASIRQLNSSDAIQLYPNPAKDFVMVESELLNHRDVQIALLNAIGENVLDGSDVIARAQDTVQLELNNLSKGFYFLQLSAEGRIITKKMAIE